MDPVKKQDQETPITDNTSKDTLISPPEPSKIPFTDTPPKDFGSEFDIVQPAILPPETIRDSLPATPISIDKKEVSRGTSVGRLAFDKPQKPNNKPIFLALGIFLVLLFITIGAVFTAIAYSEINIGSQNSQKTIEKFVLSLPFTPKTASFVLESSILAHQKITSQSFDLSLALKGDDPTSNPESNQLDAKLKGKIDYGDQNNVRTSLSLQITKDFNADIRKNDKLVYFKIDKLPQIFYTYLNLKEETIQPILSNWINFDTTQLNAKALEALNEKNIVNSDTSDITLKTISKYINIDILRNIKINREVLNNTNVFKLRFAPDDKTLDALGQKIYEEAVKEAKKIDPNSSAKIEDYQNISSTIKNVVVDLYIGTKDYYIRKIGLNFDVINSKDVIESYSTFGPDLSSKYAVSIVLTMDDFGKPIAVELPVKSITSDEAMKIIEQAVRPFEKQGPTSLDLKVTNANTNIAPSSSKVCPTSFQVTGTINGLGSGQITYRWTRSDGIKTPYETANLSNSKTIFVTGDTWILNEDYEGWVTLETITPNKITSTKANFVLRCE